MEHECVDFVIAGEAEEVVPELLQRNFSPASLYREIFPLLVNAETRSSMKAELAGVSRQLGYPGASSRAADIAMHMLSERSAPYG